jgi:hypothetical protein
MSFVEAKGSHPARFVVVVNMIPYDFLLKEPTALGEENARQRASNFVRTVAKTHGLIDIESTI